MKFLFALPILCCWFIVLQAQESSVQGLVMERSGTSRLANVSITNKSTGRVTISNELGLFRILASKGDILNISKPAYTDLTLVLTDLSDLVLRLQPVIELAEVKVEGQSKRQELDELREQYRKKGSYYAGKPAGLIPFISMSCSKQRLTAGLIRIRSGILPLWKEMI